jgi:hypothetical protein
MALPTKAVALAVSVRVTEEVPVEGSATGLAVHDALRPLGSPETIREIGPLNEPPPASVKTLVVDAPWIIVIWLFVRETASVAGESDTVRGIPWAAEYTNPLAASVIWTEKSSVLLVATAVGLPVSVTVHLIAPEDVIAGELHDAVKPGGKPESTLALAPVAPAGIFTPPTGVAVTAT